MTIAALADSAEANVSLRLRHAARGRSREAGGLLLGLPRELDMANSPGTWTVNGPSDVRKHPSSASDRLDRHARWTRRPIGNVRQKKF